MIIDWEFKSGLVVGLEADTVYTYDEDIQDAKACPVWYFHLLFFSVALIWD